LNITIKYSGTENDLFLILDYGSCFLYLLATLLVTTFPSFLPFYICMNVWLNKQYSWHMLGSGSAGKFYFLSILVNQLVPSIRCVFRGNNKVHRLMKPWSNLGLLFCLT